MAAVLDWLNFELFSAYNGNYLLILKSQDFSVESPAATSNKLDALMSLLLDMIYYSIVINENARNNGNYSSMIGTNANFARKFYCISEKSVPR